MSRRPAVPSPGCTIGATLLISHIVHPFGIKANDSNRVARGLGATLTVVLMLISVVFIGLNAI